MEPIPETLAAINELSPAVDEGALLVRSLRSVNVAQYKSS